ncbi:polysaccharide biosynthesis protein, partial [Kitasatospora sp. NPDC059747]
VPGRAPGPEGGGPGAVDRGRGGTAEGGPRPPPRFTGAEPGRQLRYRRVCARLRDRLPSPGRLLVVVPEGDETARRAAGQLVAEAAGDPVLRAVDVSVSRPLMPDHDGESGAVVVLSAGDWTAGELADVAGACADAGHEVVGVVVAEPVLARPGRSADRHPEGAVPVLAVGDDARRGPE